MSLIISKSTVEDVVDHLQEHAARLSDVLDVPLLLSVQRVDRAEHVAETEDAVQRRAQFVAHRGQEVALNAVHVIELHVGLGKLVHLAVQIGVHIAEFLLDGYQVVEHAVEGDGQGLELVARVNLRPKRDVAVADRVAHLAQVGKRLDNHVADDCVGRQHCQRDGNEGRRDQKRAVIVQRDLRRFVRNHDLDDRHHVARGQRRRADYL
jgi:hypothetical protein